MNSEGSPLRALQDNAQYAFLQLDDRVLVYRGADQPDMSVINPEADVWQHIKVKALPNMYTDLPQLMMRRFHKATSPPTGQCGVLV